MRTTAATRSGRMSPGGLAAGAVRGLARPSFAGLVAFHVWLLGLAGFTLHRVSWGLNFSPRTGRLGLVFAVENLTDQFYREQFQFAPARGRTFTAAFSVR